MSVHNPYKKRNDFEEIRERQSQNRSTLYKYFKECGMEMNFINIGKGRYKVFYPNYKWDTVYLLVDNIRFTDFYSIILFSNELVIRYSQFDTSQVNIPYKEIEEVVVTPDLAVGYEGARLNIGV